MPTPEQLNDIELLVLAHRFMYYVQDDPIIGDYEYDMLERMARELLPPESPVQGVGSSLRGSYADAVVQYAYRLRHGE